MSKSCSLENLQAEISLGNLSCVSLVRHYISNSYNLKSLNAIIEAFEDRAYYRARAVFPKHQSGSRGKLAGLILGGIMPISIHFNQNIDNLPIRLLISANEFEGNALFKSTSQIHEII